MRLKLFIVAILLAIQTADAQELGSLGGAYIGPRTANTISVLTSSITTYTSLSTADRGWAYRFRATDTKDIKTVCVNFSALSSPGTVECRIETIDASTGKPTGSLYDANATVTLTPGSTGWVAFTFASLPTTGLTAGDAYAIVLISGGGTTCTLNSSVNSPDPGSYPNIVLTCPSSSAATRSNFAEVTGTVGICYAVMEDNQVYNLDACSSAATGLSPIYGTDIVVGMKVVLPVDVVVRGIATNNQVGIVKTGTPAGDLRVRILNSSNTAVVTATIDKDQLATGVNGRGLYVSIPNTTLAAGTYRIALDSASSANSSNCWQLRYATLPDAKLQSSAFCHTESSNASTTFTWTDTTTRQASLGLMIDSISAGSSNTIDPLTGTIPGL